MYIKIYKFYIKPNLPSSLFLNWVLNPGEFYYWATSLVLFILRQWLTKLPRTMLNFWDWPWTCDSLPLKMLVILVLKIRILSLFPWYWTLNIKEMPRQVYNASFILERDRIEVADFSGEKLGPKLGSPRGVVLCLFIDLDFLFLPTSLPTRLCWRVGRSSPGGNH